MASPRIVPTGVLGGIAGKDGSNVLPTDTAIKNAIQDPASQTSAALSASIARRGVFMGDYPRQGAESTDDAALDRALAFAEDNDITLLIFSGGEVLTQNHIIDRDGMTFVGMGRETRVTWGADVPILDVTGNEFTMRDIQPFASTTGRTAWPIQTHGLRPVFDNVFFYGVSGAYRNGVWIKEGNDATIRGCLFNHAGARLSIYDVSIMNTWVQAISTEFGIGLDGGQGNLELTDVKIVPPLRSVASAKAGLYILGPAFKIQLNGLYIDGNGELDTREGVWLGDGVGQVTGDITSNNMSSDVVVLDGVVGVDLHITNQSGNRRGNGAREVVVKQTGAQPVQSVRLRGLARMTAPIPTGTTGPAIEVMSPVDCSEVTIDVDVVQPAGGNGYSVPEIKVHDPNKAVILGRGTLSKYRAHGKVAVANGDAAVSVTLSSPYPLAYRPLAGDISFMTEDTVATVARVQFTGDNSLYVPFVAAASGAGWLHWRVDFAR